MIQKVKICKFCKGKGTTKIRRSPIDTPDTRRMLAIMKRNKLNQTLLSQLLGISQGTIAGWFKQETNKQGKIKSIYFEMLKIKGIK